MPVVRSVMKPRVRGVAGGEVKLPTWEQYREQAPLGQRALEQILCGVPTRKYHRSLESFGDVETAGTGKSLWPARAAATNRRRTTDRSLGRSAQACRCGDRVARAARSSRRLLK